MLVGDLLAETQPAIIVASPALLGRTSLGSGSPEQIAIGSGLTLNAGTISADGIHLSAIPVLSTLPANAELVVAGEGSPMLLPASLLTGLFTAGQNVVISPSGTISVEGVSSTPVAGGLGSAIAELAVVSSLTAQDLVAASHAGADCAISYANLIDGVTIDEAQPAGPAEDTDTLWVAQGGNVMSSQSFSAIWSWITGKLPTYKAPVLEITASTNLDMTVHNGRLLICSQPVTLTAPATNLGGGFNCTVINVSTGSVTLGSGFVSSNGSATLSPWQSASLFCASYSGGMLLFASISSPAAGTAVAPGQVTTMAVGGTTASSITVSWTAPSTGASPTSYVLQYCPAGSSSWTATSPITGATSYQITGLQAATSYNITIQALTSGASGPLSAILTTSTAASSQTTTTLPVVSNVTAVASSSTAVQLNWSVSGGTASSFTVQYSIAGSGTWTTLTGITATTALVSSLSPSTNYDFIVAGVNSAGNGPNSSVVMASTPAEAQSVTSITWNVTPSGSYTHGSGAIGVNAQVSPASSPIQFGFSTSASTPPSSWTAAILVNTNLWGAYVTTPATAGTWYAWAEGLDGSALTVYPTPFTVV